MKETDAKRIIMSLYDEDYPQDLISAGEHILAERLTSLVYKIRNSHYLTTSEVEEAKDMARYMMSVAGQSEYQIPIQP